MKMVYSEAWFALQCAGCFLWIC